MTLGYYDDNDFYLAGFSASPLAPLLAVGKQHAAQVVQRGRQHAAQAVQRGKQHAAQEIQRQTGIDPTKIPTSAAQVRGMVEREAQQAGVKVLRDLGQRVGAQEAEKLFNETLQRFTPPGIKGLPVQPVAPKELTVGAIRDAAIETSLRTTEAFIRQKTGLPIELPRKFNLKEIERTVTGLLPGDAKEALQLGINIGVQYASSALAGVVAGATIGSTVPGLGTVIGIGMGLAIQALAAPQVQPHQRPCTSMVKCPLGSTGKEARYASRAGRTISTGYAAQPQSPMELLPWVAENLVMPTSVLAQERARAYCGVGATVECIAAMHTAARGAYAFAKDTPQVLGLPQVNRYLPLYERALRFEHSIFNVQARRIDKTRGEVGQRFLPDILAKLRRRQQELSTFVAKADRMEQLSPNEHSTLQWPIIAEIKNAAQQYAVAPSSETQQWLAKVSDYSRRWGAYRQNLTRKIAERAEAGKKRFETRKSDPAQQRAHVLQQLKFQCGQDNQAACAEYRRIAAGGSLTAQQLKQFGSAAATPRPTRTSARSPARTPVRPPSADPQLYKRCYTLVVELVKRDPRSQKCLTRVDLDRLAKICMTGHGPAAKTTPQKALVLMATYADNVCKSKGL
jgi:hypothetical protein